MSDKKLSVPTATQELLAFLAAIVAIEAPARQGKYSSSAQIPWDTVRKIRWALDEAGWPWREAQAARVDRERAAKKVYMDKHYPPEGEPS